MITHQIERLYCVIDEIEPLIEMHYNEVTLHKDVMKLDVDWSRYAELERVGTLIVFTARDGEKLVGYCPFFVMPHIHYKNQVTAVNDAIFLHPDYRGNGGALIDFAETELKKIGAQKITFHVKIAHDFSPMLVRKKYEREEIILGKILRAE